MKKILFFLLLLLLSVILVGCKPFWAKDDFEIKSLVIYGLNETEVLSEATARLEIVPDIENRELDVQYFAKGLENAGKLSGDYFERYEDILNDYFGDKLKTDVCVGGERLLFKVEKIDQQILESEYVSCTKQNEDLKYVFDFYDDLERILTQDTY